MNISEFLIQYSFPIDYSCLIYPAGLNRLQVTELNRKHARRRLDQ
jgi:hypothetical protein